MIRLFDTHKIRQSRELGGLWHFEGGGVKTMLPVPGCWETNPRLRNFRGQGIYTKELTTTAGNLLLTFKGVSHTAKVYFDGVFLGGHYNAYTPFSLLVPGIRAGRHSIRVEVDNSFHEGSSLHIPNDYFTYGGIIRPVAVQMVPDFYLERLECNTTIRETGVFLGVKAHVSAVGNAAASLALTCRLGRQLLAFEPQAAAGSCVFEQEFLVDNPRLWCPDDPNLYSLEATLACNDGAFTDDLIERIGLRTVEVKGRSLLLNGSPLKLKGFNRHEDHPLFGASLPFAAMVQDLELLRELGSNTVRTSHYPNDELFLDLCDELGFLVWEESHARGLGEEQMRHPCFDNQSEACIYEMVTNHYNHPSIILWGLLNECASWSEYGRLCYEKQVAQIRSLDSTRPVTFASCHFFNDLCIDLVDIVSYNIYSGWYEQRGTKDFLDKLLEWSEAHGGAGKPYIVSEFGAGAIYGFRDTRHVKWSEERQQEILEDNLSAYSSDSRVIGMLIWQFCDCLVTDDQFYSRPKTRNNKGIVDEFRRPKLAFPTVKQYFDSYGAE